MNRIEHAGKKGERNDDEVLKRRQRSEEHTSELQPQSNLVCRLRLEKNKLKDPDESAAPAFHPVPQTTGPRLAAYYREFCHHPTMCASAQARASISTGSLLPTAIPVN